MPPLTLDQLNAASRDEFTALLDGIYEHSPWIADRACDKRPFASLAQLKRALVEVVVTEAGRDEQLALIRAHPELAGKAMVAKTLTAESTNEQGKAGLTDCTPDEFAKIQRLNAAYNAKFGFPFILAVRGPRGTGLRRRRRSSRPSSAASTTTPTSNSPNACATSTASPSCASTTSSASTPVLGNQVWDCAELLARHSDPGYAENGQLTVTYLTDAHRACAAQLDALDARVRLRRGHDRRGRQRRRGLLGRRTAAGDPRQPSDGEGAEAAAHRQPLRHRAQRRQVRRPPRHLRADGLRARAASRRPAPAVRARGRRLRRRRRPALQGDLPRLGRADRPVRPGLARPAGRRRRDDARRDAPRRPAGHDRRARSPS